MSVEFRPTWGRFSTLGGTAGGEDLPSALVSPDPEHLVSVSTWEAEPGREDEVAAIGERAIASTGHAPGHLAGTVLHEPDSRDFSFVHTFVDAESLERWQASPERAGVLRELGAVAKRKGNPQRLTGLETWFASQRSPVETIKPPPRWKMWLASFAGAYPLVVLFQWLLAPELSGLPLLIRSAVFPLILLSLMTYAMMPLVTRLLRAWLYPDG